MPRREDSNRRVRLLPRAECFLLCDHARAENGKLYVLGGGWDEVVPERLPISYRVSIAGKVVLPGEMAIDSVRLRVEMVDDDGRAIGETPLDRRLRATPTAERSIEPDGAMPEAPALFAVDADLELRSPGRVSFRLLVDEELVAVTRLTVAPPPSAEESATGTARRSVAGKDDGRGERGA